MSINPAALQQSMLLVTQAKGLVQERNYHSAVQFFQRAIRICPSYSLAYLEFINMLIEQGDFNNALKVIQACPPSIYQKSWALQERHGIILSNLEKYKEALPIFENLVGNKEINKSRLYSNIATTHYHLSDEEKSLYWLEKAACLKNGSVIFYNNITTLLLKLNKIQEAKHAFDDALNIHKNDININYIYSCFLLCDEDYENGFYLYQRRWESEMYPQPLYTIPLKKWNGDNKPKSLLLFREQGIGDEIMFSSFYPSIHQITEKLTVVCDDRLQALLSHSYPDIQFVCHQDVASIDTNLHDFFLYAADCGHYAHKDIGWKNGYLKPDSQRSQILREKYQTLFPDKKLIGFSWKSTREGILGEQRAAPLALWKNVLINPDCQFINLQYGDIKDDLRYMRETLGVDIYEDPDIDCHRDIDGLAAQMAALDLVITTTNTTAHLAAAINAPTWITTPVGVGTFWCWGFREKTPFYPEARLFRAKKFGEWEPVIQAVDEALRQFLKE